MVSWTWYRYLDQGYMKQQQPIFQAKPLKFEDLEHPKVGSTADLLAKEGVTEDLMSRRTLTFSEIFSKTKSLIQELWKTPPTHPWYNRQAPGGALSIKADRVVQTTISRLASGHTRGLSFHLGQKIYENCTKCNLVQATPDHLLFCAGHLFQSSFGVRFPEDSWAHGPGLACG
ncbi:uncharacterized protein TNCV_4914191 [Trichonephila clavipes]|nr:uncharacterized protein TNCV_4914191 [Trichonephila clavipes]